MNKLRSRIKLGQLLVSFGVAVGLVLIVVGLMSAQTGREALNLPDAIDNMSPGDGDRVLRQSNIFIDFITGYTGELTIDGITLETSRLDELTNSGKQPIPGEQVELPPNAIFDPGNYTLSFLPTAGAAIEKFTQGQHQATVRYWKETGDKNESRTYSWKFYVD